MGRSNSVTKETEGRGRAAQFRKEIQRSRNSNSRLDELIKQDNQKGRLNKDDMDVDMTSPNKTTIKKTRSLSGKEDLKIDVQKTSLGKNAATKGNIQFEEEKSTEKPPLQRPPEVR